MTDRELARRVDIQFDPAPGLGQIDRDHDVVAGGVGEPLAGRLDPKDAIQFYRRIARCGLHQQWFASNPSRNRLKRVDFRCRSQ